MKMKHYIHKFSLAIFFALINMWTFAQPPPGGPAPGGGSTGGDPPCWDPDCIPIDGGLGFLIAAGAVIGVRKLYSKTV